MRIPMIGSKRESTPAVLKVRRPPFRFGPDTPFLWNPENPYFSMTGNAISFVAPAFEQFLVLATHDAIPRMKDPAVVQEAEGFLRQEAVHSKNHRLHAAALVEKYPGLAQITPELDRRFTELYRNSSLEFNVAYGADVEATFTPLFNTILRNRASMIDAGHRSVGPLFLWHFVEEIEHRSSAFRIYNAVVDDPWYRVRVLPKVFSHLLGCAFFAFRTFDAVVPESDRLVTASHLTMDRDMIVDRIRTRLPRPLGGNGKTRYPGQMHAVPWAEKLSMVKGLAVSQYPSHDPEHEQCPPFAFHWMDEFDRGRNVVDWYSEERA
jgi:predicted metal-dependent hydrolase